MVKSYLSTVRLRCGAPPRNRPRMVHLGGAAIWASSRLPAGHPLYDCCPPGRSRCGLLEETQARTQHVRHQSESIGVANLRIEINCISLKLIPIGIYLATQSWQNKDFRKFPEIEKRGLTA